MTEIGGSGPPPIPKGRGVEFLRMEEPYRLVNLDAAVFDWLWRLTEAKYRQHRHNNFLPEQLEVAKRAVIAFREAAGTLEPPRVTKVLHRKVARSPRP